MTGDALGGTFAVVVNGVSTLSISRVMQRRAQRMLYVQIKLKGQYSYISLPLYSRGKIWREYCAWTPDEGKVVGNHPVF
jgi:hypothetical protein